MSEYSRVRASGLSKRTPCQPSDTCGPETPSPSRKRPPDSVSSVAAVIAQFAGRAARDLEDRRADVDALGLRGDEGEHGRRVGAVGLGDPGHRVAEVVGLLREREVVGVVAGAPVAEVHAELHGASGQVGVVGGRVSRPVGASTSVRRVKQRHLGRSGLVVSRLALGTMTWGRDTDEDDAAAQLVAFREAGGTLVDTADVYAGGASETRARAAARRRRAARRGAASRPRRTARPGPGRWAAAPRAATCSSALDASLERLGTDHVDLWQLHAWDPVTPWEEAMAALDTAVASGRVRYAGVSNYSGWQLGATATWQRAWPGRAPLVANQVEYSLLQRGVEREVVPAAQALGVGLLPWSPLGRGVLTGKYRNGSPADSRGASAHFSAFVAPYLAPSAGSVVDAVLTAADGLGRLPRRRRARVGARPARRRRADRRRADLGAAAGLAGRRDRRAAAGDPPGARRRVGADARLPRGLAAVAVRRPGGLSPSGMLRPRGAPCPGAVRVPRRHDPARRHP